LAVSRSIGDVIFCRAIIPTPDIFCIDLLSQPQQEPPTIETESDNANEPKCTNITRRFVIASDGLFDALSNDAVGKLAARKAIDDNDNKNTDPKTTASRIVQQALKEQGAIDDITVLVIDVTVRIQK
jgi:serine/threonine protein phosphatase PrpC